jgi:hypothetical protein
MLDLIIATLASATGGQLILGTILLAIVSSLVGSQPDIYSNFPRFGAHGISSLPPSKPVHDVIQKGYQEVVHQKLVSPEWR